MEAQARRTQAERRSQSEGALLKAAIDLIAREGVSAVTFEAVGRAGGFSRGLPGQRFGSKARLIEAVLRELHAEQETMLAVHRFDERPGLDAVLGYAELGLRAIGGRRDGPAYFRLLAWSIAEAHESRAEFAAMHGRVAARLEGWIARGQAEGTIRPEIDPAAMAVVIGGSMLGLSIQCLIDDDAGAETLQRACLAGIRASLESGG